MSEKINLEQLKLLYDALESSGIITASAMSQQEGSEMKKQITIRSDGRYMATVYDRNHKRKYIYGMTEVEVRNKIKEFKRKDKIVDEAGKNIYTLSDFIDYWLKTYKYRNVKSSTYDRIESTYIHHVKNNKIGDMALYNITLNDMQMYINAKIDSGLSLSSLKKIIELLDQSLEKAVSLEYITKNPMDKVEFRPCVMKTEDPDCDDNDESLDSFTDSEKEKLKYAISNAWSKSRRYRTAPAILLNFKLGLRIGELIALTWDDIDFDNRIIKINKGNVVIKERDENLNYTGKMIKKDTTPKTKAGRRRIEICDAAIDVLRELQRRNQQMGISSKYVVCTNKGTQETKRNFARTLEVVCRAAGIDYKSSHKIRKTWTSNLIDQDVPLSKVTKLIGHTNSRTTISAYYKPTDDVSEKVRLAMEKM